MAGTSVNCWFCNEDSIVPARAARDGWDCPKCDQFNSFTPDGDVALPVSATSGLTNVRYNVATQPTVEPVYQLCRSCNLNQMLKSRQLANFRPIVEENWQAELNEYRAHLENIYGVCARCQAVVARALQEKDDMVRPTWLAWVKHLQEKMESAAGALKEGEWRRSRAGKLRGAIHAAASIVRKIFVVVQCGGLVLLLSLLLNNRLYELGADVVPQEYVDILKKMDCVFQESKGILAFMCFTMWVVMLRPNLTRKSLVVLVLWVYFCVVEMLTGEYVSNATSALLEVALVAGLVACALDSPANTTVKVIGTKMSSNGVSKTSAHLQTPVSSSTPKVAPNGVPNNLQSMNGTLVHHVNAAPSLNCDTIYPLTMEKPSSLLGSPSKRRHDSTALPGDACNLLNLSLGSPRKSATSQGVFTLRTYTPDRHGSQLFARPRRLLSPARLQAVSGGGGDLSHSAWIAGGFWQRGQPALVEANQQDTLLSRSSSQSSGFVDAFGQNGGSGGGSVLGDDRPLMSPPISPSISYGRHSPPTSEPPYHSGSLAGGGELALPPTHSYAGARYGDCRSCASATHSQCGGSSKSHLDASSQMSVHSSFAASQTGSILDGPATNRSVLIALLLGFSVAFNVFAVLFLVFRDRV